MDPLDVVGLFYFLLCYGMLEIWRYRRSPDEFQVIREFYESQP